MAGCSARRGCAGPRRRAAERGARRRRRRGDAAVCGSAGGAPLRLIQGKEEAKLFYAFLSKVYDHVVNPGHWTESMRADALRPLGLSPGQTVYDVGGGTGLAPLLQIVRIVLIGVMSLSREPTKKSLGTPLGSATCASMMASSHAFILALSPA